MGLAASQAKLLSITSRLSDNELRSQSITCAKMALASKSSKASRDYIEALNATELVYSTYDLDGNKTYVDLTGAQLSQFAPLKTQYALVNNKGQVLISETDAANYEDSANIKEFVQKYGIEVIDTGNIRTIENPDFEPAYKEYQKKYQEWLSEKPDPADKRYWTENSGTDSELYKKFLSASEHCYREALGGRSACYLHVLAHMLDLSNLLNGGANAYQTTLGDNVAVTYSYIWGSYIYGDGQTKNMVPVSDAVCNGYKGKTMNAAERPEDTLTSSSSKADKLLSNYYIDTDGTKQIKTLKQKIIDLFYAVKNYQALGIPYGSKNDDKNADTLIGAIKRFQEDMELAFKELMFNRQLYEADEQRWLLREPPMTDVPPTLEEPIYEYYGDGAQWYVNLWHRINGPKEEKDGTRVESFVHTSEGEDGEKVVTKEDKTSMRYDVLEDGLMNSAEWLKYSLETGSVTLERVNSTNPTEVDTGLIGQTWTSIIYSNALEISEQTDEAAIAKAEAEYEATTKDLEAKDKQYDSMLKLLDTEHNALQAEFDSVKSVITKNTERTLKIYSA